jgi:hypothetical protein
MKFPISRESLQTFTRAKEIEEMNKEMIEKQIILDLDKFSKDFKNYMMGYQVEKEKRFVWGFAFHMNNMINGNKITKDEYINMFIEKLKELFIDCDFIMDPLKTYIIIDWS